MPESFEHHFAQEETGKKEEPKFPEEIKEPEALARLIEEIKAIKAEMKEKGETAEGYERIIAIIKQREALYEEKEFQSEKAKERLEQLKETELWDKEKEQWNWRMNEEGKVRDYDRLSSAQLLGVLAEAVAGNPDTAKERLEKLKETKLWDKEKKQWNWWMDKEGAII